jgi:hypothetical protein
LPRKRFLLYQNARTAHSAREILAS